MGKDYFDDWKRIVVDLDQLRAELQEYKDLWKLVMSEDCPSDEKHCTCVPALKIELKASQAEVIDWQKISAEETERAEVTEAEVNRMAKRWRDAEERVKRLEDKLVWKTESYEEMKRLSGSFEQAYVATELRVQELEVEIVDRQDTETSLTRELVKTDDARIKAEADSKRYRDLSVKLYTQGYARGHDDTVEGCYTDVVPVDEPTYFAEEVEDFMAEQALKEVK